MPAKTPKENDKYIARKLRQMMMGHEQNFDVDGQVVRLSIRDNKLFKKIHHGPEDIEEEEINEAQLTQLVSDHIMELDEKTNVTKRVSALADKYNNHTARVHEREAEPV
ncbi:MAG: hypothetical protein CMB80_08120 [Flammeovirgaceae bacterium]|nr:hypothetical protein [Flammeovirgaceae bacterium]|tara:strand:- start:3167 stop:3493 length:327 start_codon:yes stop_codon:yes gene_type:complete